MRASQDFWDETKRQFCFQLGPLPCGFCSVTKRKKCVASGFIVFQSRAPYFPGPLDVHSFYSQAFYCSPGG